MFLQKYTIYLTGLYQKQRKSTLRQTLLMMRVMVDSLNITVKNTFTSAISARKKSDGSRNYEYLYI